MKHQTEDGSTIEIFPAIRAWAKSRGLYDSGDIKTQYVKLGEEFGELGKAIINSNDFEITDAIGDIVIVLTNLAHMHGVPIEDCIAYAYEEIANRKGKMIKGSFVKYENLCAEDKIEVNTIEASK